MYMLRLLLACAVFFAGLTEASAQATQPRTYTKLVPYSVRKPRPKQPATKAKSSKASAQNTPRTEQLYLAPGVPMYQQMGYARMGSYSGRETLPKRPAAKAPAAKAKQPANTSLSSGTTPQASKAKAKVKAKTKAKPKKARRWRLFR